MYYGNVLFKKGVKMSDFEKHKHMIGAIAVMLILSYLVLPKGIIGTVINLSWLLCFIYAQVKQGVSYKEKPEFKDYFLIHYEAIKFTAKNLFKS